MRKKMINEQHKEIAQSAISYTIGGGGAYVATLMDASQVAQALALIVGSVVICIRAIHDGVKLYRYIKKGKE